MGAAARFLSQGLEPDDACRAPADAGADARACAADRRAPTSDRREARGSPAGLGNLTRPLRVKRKTPGAYAPGVWCAASPVNGAPGANAASSRSDSTVK